MTFGEWMAGLHAERGHDTVVVALRHDAGNQHVVHAAPGRELVTHLFLFCLGQAGEVAAGEAVEQRLSVVHACCVPRYQLRHAWPDSVFVERLWRLVKRQEVYLRADDNAPDARTSIEG